MCKISKEERKVWSLLASGKKESCSFEEEGASWSRVGGGNFEGGRRKRERKGKG